MGIDWWRVFGCGLSCPVLGHRSVSVRTIASLVSGVFPRFEALVDAMWIAGWCCEQADASLRTCCVSAGSRSTINGVGHVNALLLGVADPGGARGISQISTM